MTVHISIHATSDAAPSVVLQDLGSRLGRTNHMVSEDVAYDINQVDVETILDAHIVDEREPSPAELGFNRIMEELHSRQMSGGVEFISTQELIAIGDPHGVWADADIVDDGEDES